MKKIVIICIFSLLLGTFLGKVVIDKLNNNISSQASKYFFIKESQYNRNIGITRDYEIAEVLTELFNNDGLDVFIDEIYLKNEELKNNVEQFDLLVKESKNKDEILKIEEVVLACYEEIVKKY